MENIRKHNLGLKKEDNEEFFRLRDKYNIVGRKVIFINEKIIKMKQPKLFLLCQKYRIKSFANYISILQIMIDDWASNFNDFIQKPSITFSGDEERVLGFIHYMRLLELMDYKINKLFDTTVANFIKVQERQSNQINFVIAIVSALISTAGVIIAIFSIK